MSGRDISLLTDARAITRIVQEDKCQGHRQKRRIGQATAIAESDTQAEVIRDSKQTEQSFEEVIPPIKRITRKEFLRQNANRRITVQSVNLTVRADRAKTPWDICNVKQLEHWIKKNSDQLLEAKYSLRQRGDQAIDLLDAITYELEISDRNFERAQERLIQVRVNTGNGSQRDTPAATPTPSSASSTTKSKIKRFPDSPVFSETNGDVTLDDWA